MSVIHFPLRGCCSSYCLLSPYPWCKTYTMYWTNRKNTLCWRPPWSACMKLTSRTLFTNILPQTLQEISTENESACLFWTLSTLSITCLNSSSGTVWCTCICFASGILHDEFCNLMDALVIPVLHMHFAVFLRIWSIIKGIKIIAEYRQQLLHKKTVWNKNTDTWEHGLQIDTKSWVI